MRKILIPIDGSEHSLRAVDVILMRRDCEKEMEIHLLNVQMLIDSGHARMFVSEEALHDFHQSEGIEALSAARKKLDDASVAYRWHVIVGHTAETIVQFAHEHNFNEIVMGSHGRSALTHLLLGSIAFDVLRTAQLPVTLVK